MRGFKAFMMMLPVVTLVAPAAASAQIKADTKEQPAIHEGTKLGLANRFKIQIDGREIAQFAELVALNARSNPPTVVLKRGKNSSMDMWAWHEAARSGDMAAARKSATLVMYDYDGKPVARYHLVNAWPSKIETGGLESGTGKVAVETLELAHEGFLETVTIVAEDIQRVSP
ncbi:MAG: phage tail protein [Gemmatimonadota bacterium]